MKDLKRILIPLLLLLSILMSACASEQTGTDVLPSDTTLTTTDTTADIDGNLSDETPDGTPDERYGYDAWKENAYTFLNSVKITPEETANTYISDDSTVLAWTTSYMLDALYRGYCATGDTAFLDQMSIYLYRIYGLMEDKDGDGYLNWGSAYYSEDGSYEEYAVHTSMLGLTAGKFVCLVYADSTLAEKESSLGMSFFEVAEYIIDKTVNHLIPAYERDWNEEAGVYQERNTEQYGKQSLPHNQYLTMAVMLIDFAKVSPEHSELYLHRAEKMLNAFSRNVVRYPHIGLMEWNYSDPQFEGDGAGTSTEDYSHGMIDIRGAIAGYSNGFAFSLEDIEAFANNYSTVMYRDNGEYSFLSHSTDGTGVSDGVIFYWIYDSALYRNVIAERGMEYMLHSNTQRGTDAPQALVYHPDTPKPEDFSLTVPANGDTVDTDTAVFLWERTACANYYLLEIAEDENFENIIVSRDKMPDSSTIVKGLPENTGLYYRVTAKNMKGEETVSEVYSFTVKEGDK